MRVGLQALVVVVVAASSVQASQTQVHSVEGTSALLDGDFDAATITGDGVLKAGPEQKVVVDGVAGAVLALARAGDGQLYAATGAPGRVLKVVGSKTEDVFTSDKPLITALLPVGKDRLVALTAPDGGAEIIELATKKRTTIAAKDVKLLLAGVVVDDVVYAVGGNDDGGVILKLAPGAKDFEVVAKTKESLRSVAATKVGGKLRLVAGSSDEGIVYDVDVTAPAAKNSRALLDATPGEVTALAIAPDGTVFAALVDSDAKLSKQATTKAKDDASDDDKTAKKPAKARKVKGGELWRLAPGGAARVIFSSKEHGPYAIGLQGSRVLLGTGPQGRVVDVDASGAGRPGVWTRKNGNDEVTALLVEKAGVLAGTSHAGAVLFIGGGTAPKAAYLSPALDADARARFGMARVRVTKGAAKVALRTGNTKEPDDTWSAWSTSMPASMAGVALSAPTATFAQLKVELPAGTEVTGLHLAYLVDNRAPEIVNVDVLAPGWKVVSNPREPPETRSVTFNDKPFAKFLDRRGSQNPTLDERPYGKQSFDVGYRTVYAFVEDADKDALRYRFWLGSASKDGTVASWSLLEDWSEAPFSSFEASRLQDGDYRVKIDVDDSITNGATRALSDGRVSAPFIVSHVSPRASETSATRTKSGVRVKLKVDAALPLVSVRCSTGLSPWLPLDPLDGILDGATEAFDVEIPSSASGTAASCEIYDEALNFGRLDIPVKP
ncbi:MAG: hypothetical protein Q8O67_23195 [Deltaproteobacteria bacterium]|nr:hypothetical protein [Deltaproteobacteria bacterium]